MHRLSDILDVRERIVDLINYVEHEHAFEQYAGHLSLLFSSNAIVQQPFQTLIGQDCSAVKQSLQQIKERCNDVITQLDIMRREQEQSYFAASEKLYQENLHAIEVSGSHVVYSNALDLDQQGLKLIDERIGLFTDWRLPGMMIRPGKENFINKMVELDPLYIVDIDLLLLEPALSRYNEIYQRRLRKYEISDSQEKIFADLPPNQFGLVFAHNFFNLRTVQVITKYLRSVFDILRPGGVFAFTFCDADSSRCVKMCENNFYCYTPGQVLQHNWDEIGYQLQFKYRSDAQWTYVEIKKPGSIDSNRAGQSLAQILPIQS